MSTTRDSTTRDQPTDEAMIYVTTELLLAQRFQTLRLNAPRRSVNSIASPGDVVSRRRGHGIEFEQIRPYQPGDEIRRIDWRALARTGIPYTREYVEDHERTVLIALDQRPNMFFGSNGHFKSCVAAVLAAQIGWTAVADDSRLGGVVMSDRLMPIAASRPQATMLKLIRLIVEMNRALSATSQATTTLNQLLQQIYQINGSASTVFLISDFFDFDSDCAATIRALTTSNEVVLLKVIDPLEQSPPTQGLVGVSNGVDHGQLRLNPETHERYVTGRQKVDRILRQCVDSTSASLVQADTINVTVSQGPRRRE